MELTDDWARVLRDQAAAYAHEHGAGDVIGEIAKTCEPFDAKAAADQQAAFQRAQAENNRQFQAIMQKGREDNDRLLANGRAFNRNLRASTDRALAGHAGHEAGVVHGDERIDDQRAHARVAARQARRLGRP